MLYIFLGSFILCFGKFNIEVFLEIDSISITNTRLKKFSVRSHDDTEMILDHIINDTLNIGDTKEYQTIAD